MFCIRQFALHRQQPEKDEQNVDFSPPGRISADAHGYRTGLKPMQPMHLHWVPRLWDPAPW